MKSISDLIKPLWDERRDYAWVYVSWGLLTLTGVMVLLMLGVMSWLLWPSGNTFSYDWISMEPIVCQGEPLTGEIGGYTQGVANVTFIYHDVYTAENHQLVLRLPNPEPVAGKVAPASEFSFQFVVADVSTLPPGAYTYVRAAWQEPEISDLAQVQGDFEVVSCGY
jgi:hypothetical protein